MKTHHILAITLVPVVLLLGVLLCGTAAFLIRHKIVGVSFGSPTPEKIVWDFTTRDDISRVGWPATNKNTGYYRTGDFDFTFIRGSKVFHERAQGFGCTRKGNYIDFFVIHFGSLISAEEAYYKTKQVLNDYGGGETPPNRTAAGGISLDEWYSQMKKGTYYLSTFGASGIHGGTVVITIHHERDYQGLQRRCNLAFQQN